MNPHLALTSTRECQMNPHLALTSTRECQMNPHLALLLLGLLGSVK